MSSEEVKYCPVCNKEYTGQNNCTDDGSILLGKRSDTDPLIGQVLKETYRIEEKIGEGGMGAVYRAVQMPLGRNVAVKTLLSSYHQSSPDSIKRFFREAKLLSQLSHPNIVSIIDFGNTADGFIYMVMEYLQGHGLDDIVPEDKGLPVKTALDIMGQICSGVGAAHFNSMVHRDLKPSNVFLTQITGNDEVIKILDFGIAKETKVDQTQLTQSGAIVGSPGFISPEQITGASEADARSDIYALGAILYFMLAGRQAYKAGNTQAILTRQLIEAPEPIDFEKLGKPEAKVLEPIIMKAMAPEPDDRFQTCSEMIAEIEQACEKSGLAQFARTMQAAGAGLAQRAARADQATLTSIQQIDGLPKAGKASSEKTTETKQVKKFVVVSPRGPLYGAALSGAGTLIGWLAWLGTIASSEGSQSASAIAGQLTFPITLSIVTLTLLGALFAWGFQERADGATMIWKALWGSIIGAVAAAVVIGVLFVASQFHPIPRILNNLFPLLRWWMLFGIIFGCFFNEQRRWRIIAPLLGILLTLTITFTFSSPAFYQWVAKNGSESGSRTLGTLADLVVAGTDTSDLPGAIWQEASVNINTASPREAVKDQQACCNKFMEWSGCNVAATNKAGGERSEILCQQLQQGNIGLLRSMLVLPFFAIGLGVALAQTKRVKRSRNA